MIAYGFAATMASVRPCSCPGEEMFLREKADTSETCPEPVPQPAWQCRARETWQEGGQHVGH